jgi:predicted RND superfamily exporter protein
VGGVLSYLVPLRRVAESLDVHSAVSTLSRRQIADLNTVLDFAGESQDDPMLLSSEKERARSLVYMRNANYQRGSRLISALETGIANSPHAREVAVDLSGDIPVAVDVVHAIVVNQLRSIALALVGVALVLVLLSRSLSLVAVVIAPVAAALLVLFGIMGYAGMSLGIATSMFASLTVGVGVDFALHVQHTYARERAGGAAHRGALSTTLAQTGRAIRWNVGVLAAGFSVLALSQLAPNRALGMLLGAAMLVCYAMTLLLLPQLLRLFSTTQTEQKYPRGEW